ncbi:MAG: oligosaccharide flippase family protein [Burkholderiaceae bacterium]
MSISQSGGAARDGLDVPPAQDDGVERAPSAKSGAARSGATTQTQAKERSVLGAMVRHSVFRNTMMLFAVTVLNYVMPLVLIPFLARVLGVELYGVYAFGMSLYLIGLLVIDYGFPVHGLYSVVESRDDPERVGRLLSCMLIIKLGLFALLTAALAGFVWYSGLYVEHRLFLMLTALPVLGAALQFRWVFLAVEKSGAIFRYTVVGRVLQVVLVIALVARPEDYLLVPISQGIATILSGALCIGMMYRLGLKFRVPSWKDVIDQLRGASSYFWANVAGANLGFMGVFVLGLVASPAALAIYAAAEQLYRAIRSLYYPLADALVPYMKRSNDTKVMKRLLWVVCGGTFVGVAIGLVIAPQVVQLLFGPGFEGAAYFLRILLLAFLPCVPSILIGYPLLGTMGYGPQINHVVVLAAIISMSTLGLLWYFEALGGTTVAWMIVGSEGFIFAGLMLLLLRALAKRRNGDPGDAISG